jgi:hypothetical protein
VKGKVIKFLVKKSRIKSSEPVTKQGILRFGNKKLNTRREINKLTLK